MEKKKNNRNNRSLLVVILIICLLVVLGLILYKNSKKPDGDSLKAASKIKEGTVYYQNSKKDAYIKFKSDNVYEWVYYNDKGKLEKETGYYKNGDGFVTLNHRYQAVVMGDFVEVRNPLEEATDAYHYTNYVDKTKMDVLFAKMEKRILEYKNTIGKANDGAKITDIEVNVEECYRYQRDFNKTNESELICKTDVKLHFDEYDKKTCEKQGSKINIYATDPVEPVCKKNYLDASGYVKYDLDNDYEIRMIYPRI